MAGGASDSDVGDRQVIRGCLSGYFARDEAAPGLMAFVDNLCRVLLVLGFTREGKGVFGLSIGCTERLKVNKDITSQGSGRI